MDNDRRRQETFLIDELKEKTMMLNIDKKIVDNVCALHDKTIKSCGENAVLVFPSPEAEAFILKLVNEGFPERAAVAQYIDDLQPEDQRDLAALMLFGRGDFSCKYSNVNAVIREAEKVIKQGHVGDYLAAKKPLSRYLRKGVQCLT